MSGLKPTLVQISPSRFEATEFYTAERQPLEFINFGAF